MKNKIIFITLILILIATIVCLPNKTYAANSMSDIIKEGDSFIAARDTDNVIKEEALIETSNFIYKTLLTIAIVIAFAVGMIIGIQFIMGSIDEKAKIKETLVPYLVGVFVIFSAFTIWKIAINIGNKVSPTPDAVGSGTGTIPPGTENIGDSSGMGREKLYKCPKCSGNIDGIASACLTNRGWTYCSACDKIVITSSYNGTIYSEGANAALKDKCKKCGEETKKQPQIYIL